MRGIDVRLLEKQGSNSSSEGDKKPKKGIGEILTREISIFGRKVSNKTKESFYLEMHLLLSAGIDISSAFNLIISEHTKESIQTIFKNIREEIIKGASLSESLKSSRQFSEYEYYSVKIGEETGQLPLILKGLAEYYKKKITQKRQIIAALTYPSIVSSFAILAVLFMLNFVVPMFADVFKKFGGELPAITRYIIRLSDFIRDNILVIISIILVMGIYFYSKRNTKWFKKYSESFILRVPVIGKLVHKVYLARFCSSMNLMLGSRITLLRAIVLTREMIDFYPISETLHTIEEDILKGSPLNRSMSVFKIYPQKMVSLLQAGEEVNQLDFFFNRLYQQYSDETDYQVKVLGNILEPVIIIVLGLMVGVILIAMYLPLFQLGQNV